MNYESRAIHSDKGGNAELGRLYHNVSFILNYLFYASETRLSRASFVVRPAVGVLPIAGKAQVGSIGIVEKSDGTIRLIGHNVCLVVISIEEQAVFAHTLHVSFPTERPRAGEMTVRL